MEHFGGGVGAAGIPWLLACAALGAIWIAAASWRSGDGRAVTALRGLLGGLAALGAASASYGLLQLAGLDLRWEWVARGTLPALGLTALIGVVEESAKLLGLVLATPPRAGRRGVLCTAMAVAAVFAVAEAANALAAASWALALARLTFAPVAHALLSAPFAVVLSEARELPLGARIWRLAVAAAASASLHALGNFSLTRPGWGQLGYAAALLLPALWLFVRLPHTRHDRPSPAVR